MTRQTSASAFAAVQSCGYVGRKQREIYAYLYRYGPLTTNELFHGIYGTTEINQPNVHARLSELREMEAVRECGAKACSITGNTVILWDVTDKVPVKMVKRLSYKAQLKEAQDFIAEQCLSGEYRSYQDELSLGRQLKKGAK